MTAIHIASQESHLSVQRLSFTSNKEKTWHEPQSHT